MLDKIDNPPNFVLALTDDAEKKIEDFNALLNTINLNDKKKELWRQIYANALDDRAHAYMMWQDLAVMSLGDGSKHAIHGQNMAKYMERMSKANDQLIKLAELIANSEEAGEKPMTPDDVYSKIAG